MKILISGSSGFVGSRVLHQWQGRAELFTFPRGSLAAADESAIRRFVETAQKQSFDYMQKPDKSTLMNGQRVQCRYWNNMIWIG